MALSMERLKEIFIKKGVKAAYLFGSQKDAGRAFIEGKEKNILSGGLSDLDIGVVLGVDRSEYLTVYGDIYVELAIFFEPFEIDLVILNEATPFFQYDVIRGELIYCEDEDFLDRYEERVMKIASDIIFKNREFEKDFLEAIKDGYFEIAS